MKNLLFIAVLIYSTIVFSQKMKVKGDWTKTIDVSEISDAGNDYNSSYTSKVNQTKLTVSPSNNGKKNRYDPLVVYVNKEDYEWHPDLNLQIKRTSNGTDKNYSISNGTSFQTITNNYNYFFSTNGKQKNVPIQYKISGLSVLLPAESYSTEIVFTIMSY